MLINLIEKQLLDLQRMCMLAHEAARLSLAYDYDSNVIRKLYSDNRERLLDIVRELDLGHQVDWHVISGMLKTMEAKE